MSEIKKEANITYLEFLHRVQLAYLTRRPTQSPYLCDAVRSMNWNQFNGAAYRAESRAVRKIEAAINHEHSVGDWLGLPDYETVRHHGLPHFYSNPICYHKRLEILNQLIKEAEEEEALRQEQEAGPQYKCLYCGAPSWYDPSDQRPPPDYCHPEDHGHGPLD